MPLNQKTDLTVWNILCVIGSVIVVAVGATWALSRTIQSDELEGYRTAQDWNVKEAISEIKELSEQAKLNSGERKELFAIRNEVIEYKQTIFELTEKYEAETIRLADEINTLTIHSDQLQKTLDTLLIESDSIEILEGEARFLIPNTFSIGVENTFGSFASVRFGDNQSTLTYPGEKHRVNLGNKHYIVTLMKITDNSCIFAFNESQ
ncbi:MAG: hypothetical protein AAF911_07495 [Planctomycetota bacterium]